MIHLHYEPLPMALLSCICMQCMCMNSHQIAQVLFSCSKISVPPEQKEKKNGSLIVMISVTLPCSFLVVFL